MRPILVGSLCLSSVVLYAALSNPAWLKDTQDWVRSIVHPEEIAVIDVPETEAQVTAIVQANRHEVNQTMLQSDAELHHWLVHRLGESGRAVDLQALANEIQDSCPRYLKISSTAMQSSTTKGIYDQIRQWTEVQDGDFSHVAVVVRQRPTGRGVECVVFAGQRLADFVPEMIGHGRDQFFSVCPLCNHGQSGLVLARKRTVFIECPECHHTYAVIAVDLHGTFHFVSRYLTGYAPVAHFPKKMSRLSEMLHIWDEVIHSVDYVPDSADGIEDNDAWQFGPETQRLGTGDCEDSSIFLADWLASRGFEVRVALGHYGENGGHAWVVVRLEGKVYLLESTNPKADVSHAPLASDVGARYVPDVMFDGQALYARRYPEHPWGGDYWSTKQWVRVESPGTKTLSPVASKITESAKAELKVAAPSPH